MSWILIAAIVALAVTLAGGAGVLIAWRRANADDRALMKRLAKLSFGKKLRLALLLARDRRIPLAVRVIPPAMVLYLAMPLDIIPDFIPVVGQLDDIVVLFVGVGLLLRFTPRDVLEGHVNGLG